MDASQAAALVYYGDVTAGLLQAHQFRHIRTPGVPTRRSRWRVLSPDDMLIVNKLFLYVPMGDTTVTGYMIDRSTGALTAIAGKAPLRCQAVWERHDVATGSIGAFLVRRQ